MSPPSYTAADFSPLLLYSDNHLLAANKPAGLLTQDSGTGQPNLEDHAREWIRVEKGKTGAVFLQAIHRIDKPTSGVVLFARTSKALSRLNQSIRKHEAKKTYMALVEGIPKKDHAELFHHLCHKNHRAELVSPQTPDAKPARLSYKIIRQKKGIAQLEIDLQTGRYHQIRAQLSAIGHPILGDTRYGAKHSLSGSVIALHHYQLEILHPVKKEPLRIQAPLPPLFDSAF